MWQYTYSHIMYMSLNDFPATSYAFIVLLVYRKIYVTTVFFAINISFVFLGAGMHATRASRADCN